MIRTIIKIRILCRLHFLHYGLPTLEISLRKFLKYEGGCEIQALFYAYISACGVIEMC